MVGRMSKFVKQNTYFSYMSMFVIYHSILNVWPVCKEFYEPEQPKYIIHQRTYAKRRADR